jgi:hypothetical protein
MNQLIPFVGALLLAAQHPQMPPGMSHNEHLAEAAKEEALKKRGAAAMGFDQDASTHHFRLSSAGGSIEVTVRDQTDDAAIAAVRNHLRSIASEFAAGRFDKPFQTHGEVPPGVPEMRRSMSIVYKYEQLPQGGAVRLETKDIRARDAVHAFLRYQITEHRTGDPLQPNK